MTDAILKRANDLEERILRLGSFIGTIKSNHTLRIFGKPLKKAKKLTLCSTDYMRQCVYYEVNSDIKDKILRILEDERAELQKELDSL